MSTPYTKSDLRQNVITLLKASTDLLPLIQNTPDRIKGEHLYQDSYAEDVPFVVVTDGQFQENNRFIVAGSRFGIQPMIFEAYDLQPSSQGTEDVLNCIAALLRDNPLGGDARRSLTSDNIKIKFILPKQGYQEFYDEAVRLSGKRLVVDFTVELVQTVTPSPP